MNTPDISTAARWGKVALLLVLPGLLLVSGNVAKNTTGRAWNLFTKYESPFGHRTEAEGPKSPEPLVEQVVMVIVDGLTVESSTQMPFLGELATRGASGTSRAGLPSLSLAGRGVIYSGAWHEIQGQTTNFNHRVLQVEHVMSAAKKAGLVTALAAGPEPHLLLSPHVDEFIQYEPSAKETLFDPVEKELRWMGEVTRTLITEKDPNLFIIDYTMMDQFGHAFGTRSDNYRNGAQVVDDELRRLAGHMDLSRSVLIVTSDHGHTLSGGHGGHEESVLSTPLFMVGKTITPGAKVTSEQPDLAPTIAALLGTETPSMAHGRILLEALQLDEAQRVNVLRPWVAQQEGFYGRMLAVLSPGEAPKTWAALPEAASSEQLLARGAEIEAAYQAARTARRAQDRNARAPWGLLLLLAPLALAGGALALKAASLRGLAWSAGAAVAGYLIYGAAFLGAGMDWSFSTINKDEYLNPYFMKNMGMAVGGCALAVLLSAAELRRRGAGLGWGDLARHGLWTAFFLSYIFGAQIALIHWFEGIFLVWRVPDMFWALGFYLNTLAAMAVGFAALAMPVAAFAGHLVGRLFERRAEAPAPAPTVGAS